MKNLDLTPRKTWVKPVLEVALMKSAEAGSFSSTDAKHTHHS